MGLVVLIAVLAAVLFNKKETVAPPAVQNNAAAPADTKPQADCVTHGNLGMHIHPVIEITINGQPQTIPSNIGITDDCMQSIHTHDATGKIHIESPEVREFMLKDFFAAWGKQFSKDQILDAKADAQHRVVLRVDGQVSEAYENLILKDNQKISISFE